MHFHVEADQIYRILQEKISINEAVLEGLAAFIGIVPFFDEKSARNYARAMLKRYPHIYMLEVQTLIASSKREELERYMQSTGYKDFNIRTFSYAGDRTWQPAPLKPKYAPIIFLEPITEESRPALGLDIDSVPHLQEALDASIESNGPVASSPFRLVEGDMAYVIFRPAMHQTQGKHRAAGYLSIASLVVLTDDLLSSKYLENPNIACSLYFQDETGGGNTIISQVPRNRVQGEFQQLLLPEFKNHYELSSKSQPYLLKVERQLSWDMLNLPLMALTFVISSGGLVLLLYHLRRRLDTERERAEAYLHLKNERAHLDQKVKKRTAELSRLAEKLFRVQEEERRTLARELHDEIGQTLTAIKTEAVLIKDKCGRRSPEISESAETILANSNNVYDITHDIMRRLRPRALDDVGLVPSLKNCIAAARMEEQGIKIHTHFDRDLDRFGEPVNITLFRVVQEALNNVGKHAGAKNVWIHISKVSAPEQIGEKSSGFSNAVQLSVRDDGCGINPELPNQGLGLVGVRERVRALGGIYQLKTATGEGLTLAVTIPIQEGVNNP